MNLLSRSLVHIAHYCLYSLVTSLPCEALSLTAIARVTQASHTGCYKWCVTSVWRANVQAMYEEPTPHHLVQLTTYFVKQTKNGELKDGHCRAFLLHFFWEQAGRESDNNWNTFIFGGAEVAGGCFYETLFLHFSAPSNILLHERASGFLSNEEGRISVQNVGEKQEHMSKSCLHALEAIPYSICQYSICPQQQQNMLYLGKGFLCN